MTLNLGPNFEKFFQALQSPTREEVLKSFIEPNQKIANVNQVVGEKALACFKQIQNAYQSTSDLAVKKECYDKFTELTALVRTYISHLDENEMKQWEDQVNTVRDIYEKMGQELDEKVEFDKKNKQNISDELRLHNSRRQREVREKYREQEELFLSPSELAEYEKASQSYKIYHYVSNFYHLFPFAEDVLQGRSREEAFLQFEWIYSELKTFQALNRKFANHDEKIQSILNILNAATHTALLQENFLESHTSTIKTLIDDVKRQIKELRHPDNPSLLIPGSTFYKTGASHTNHALCYQITREQDGALSLTVINTVYKDIKIADQTDQEPFKYTGLRENDFDDLIMSCMAVPGIKLSDNCPPHLGVHLALSAKPHIKKKQIEPMNQNKFSCTYSRILAFLNLNLPVEVFNPFKSFLQSRALKQVEDMAPAINDEHRLMLFGDANSNLLPKLCEQAHKELGA